MSQAPANWRAVMRNVIVTGGSRGLGLCTARKLAAAGDRVIAIARRESEELHCAVAESKAASAGAIEFRAFDLANVAGIGELVRGIRTDFGPIYGLVNNAAVGTDGLLAIMHNSQIEELVTVNTISPIVFTKYVVRWMMADGGGRIVNVSSIIGFTGYSGLSVYAATKASMLGFTRSLAREVGRSNITVNAVAPGFLETEMTKGLAGEQRQQVARRSALRRLAEPDDVANAIEYLLSSKASNVTGTVMTVDAGSTA
jgi:3-oxoacyl-[acyl-carrier protein] reductase